MPFRRMGMRFLTLLILLVPWAAKAQCIAQSGPGTAALVELYTSEGCSSCPPADRWLAGLSKRAYPPGSVVPLALHVDYWDYIGWKDPYAKREFSLRQRKLSQLQRLALVYTPQVMLQGRDFRAWWSGEFDAAVARINAQPARASLRLELRGASPKGLETEVRAELSDRVRPEDVDLYLAVHESRLESRVAAGENRGRLLSHDYVVMEWQGPLAFRGPHRNERRLLPLLPAGVPGNSGVAAFVQDRRTGEVLQALLRSAC